MSDDFEDVEDEVPEEAPIKAPVEEEKHSSDDFEDASEHEEEEEKKEKKEEEVDDSKRFIREFEFVQALANPRYLNFLADQNYFNDPRFIRYLEYLQYWETPEYSHYIRYPQCLFYLRLLQNKDFRDYIKNSFVIPKIDEQSNNYWRFYMRNRIDNDLPSEEAINFKTLIEKVPEKKPKKKKSKAAKADAQQTPKEQK